MNLIVKALTDNIKVVFAWIQSAIMLMIDSASDAMNIEYTLKIAIQFLTVVSLVTAIIYTIFNTIKVRRQTPPARNDNDNES